MIRIALLLPVLLFAEKSEGEWVRRVQSHLCIDDASSALIEAKDFVSTFPDSKEARSSLILAYAANGKEDLALEAWHTLSVKDPALALDRHLLEEISWGVLRKGLESTQYGVRLSSLIGAFLTHDVRALPVLLKMMRDSNAVIRSVAVQMVGQYRDLPLRDEVSRMLREEKVWMVRLELIKACGILRMKETVDFLKNLIQSEKTTYEERIRAIEALCEMYDKISYPEWQILASSNRAGLRHLACNIAAYFELAEAKEEVLRLCFDSHPDVRIAALNAFGLYYRKITEKVDVEKRLKSLLQDGTPEVSITASWALFLSGISTEDVFARWFNDSVGEYRRLAAAAVTALGDRGGDFAFKIMQENSDPYVKANLAVGLIGQRKEVKACSDILYTFLQTEKRMWMWDTRPNPLFQILAPSQIRHVDHIPNYPESIDQMTRLNLLSLLSLAEDPRSLDAVKSFLKKRTKGITGVAAAMLLQEGDETSLEVVRQLLQDPDPDVRLQACFVLAMLGKDETVLSDLQGAYATADHDRKLHILEAMGRVGSIESFHFLISALKEPFPILRIAAAASLIQSIHR